MAHHPQSFALVILSIVNTLKSVKAAPWAALSIASKKTLQMESSGLGLAGDLEIKLRAEVNL